MRLIPNWKEAYKWFSVQAAVLGGAVTTAWIALPPDLKRAIPEDWTTWAASVSFALVLLGRVVDQGK